MPVDKELAKKYTPKTKAEFDAYVAAMDAANAAFDKPPPKKKPGAKKQTGTKKNNK